MSQKALLLETKRTAYSVEQVLENGSTLTVGELIELLSDYEEDTPVIFSNDDGYTFGEFDEDSISLF